MKVFKNKKQRFVAVFLSLVFAFMLVPFTDAYASDVLVPLENGTTYWTCPIHGDASYGGLMSGSTSYPVYKFYYKNSCNNMCVFYFVSRNTTLNYSGVSSKNIFNESSCYNSYVIGLDVTPHGNQNDDECCTITNEDCKWYLDYTKGEYSGYTGSAGLCQFAYDLFLGNVTLQGGQIVRVEGGIDNPILDEEIGTLIISKSKMYEESNGEDVNDLYNLFSWKMKTNTGFSLSDNKYARTFIQVRVESKCVVYDDRRHTKLHKKFDNYGEKAMLINSHPADSQPLKISYLTDIPNVLPKTHAETHNPVYTGYNYTLYFRVVCTDDLAVIPSDTSEWHCGGWRALDCNADILVGQSDTTENGDFDDSDNWVPDEDDGNNSIEAGSDSVHDTDDAKDDFNNSSSAVDSSVNGAISTMQSLLDMIRHVPQIISTIFSFLPNWCLNIVGLAFVALVVLIIYKLVRG